jgi:hypothetical protein
VSGWTRRSIVIALMTVAIGGAGTRSAHATCPPLDVACPSDETVGAVVDVVEDVDPAAPLDDTLDPVIDTVDPVVGDALGRVGELLGGGPIDLPDPVGGGDGGSHTGGRPSDGERPPGSESAPGAVPRDRATVRGAERSGLARQSGSTDGTAADAARGPRPDRTAGAPSGGTLGGVARSVGIVLALLGLAAAFVAIQDRLDRSDPRLALAPVESDIVEFA